VTRELSDLFRCFGGTCSILVSGETPAARADVERARRRLLAWHERFTRFRAGSELSLLNSDPRDEVSVTPDMAALIAAILAAAERTGGLVDGTLAHEVAAAGYRDTPGPPLPLPLALRLAPRRAPARPRADGGWRHVSLDRIAGTVRRPPGLAFDSGGLGKGLFADLLAEDLAAHRSFAVSAAGDVRLGGTAGTARPVHVASPFTGATIHTYALAGGGVATSGIGRRSWLGQDGRPAHHLLDPSTGRPAYTGVVQASALAPTALEAEVLAKAAVLGGPEAARSWLPHGGLVVLDDGSHRLIEASALRLRVGTAAPRPTPIAAPARAAAGRRRAGSWRAPAASPTRRRR